MKTIRYFAKGFNYSQDGPGNRLVFHLCGCNMHCPWCANPEGMDISREDKEIKSISTEEIIEEIISCEPLFYDDGGVTFTGGEATLQMDALLEVSVALKERGIGVAIETNATHPHLSNLFPYLQLLIADLKHPNTQRLASVTGVGGENVYQNLRCAVRSGIPLLVRIPVIHGFNDGDDDMNEFVEFFKDLSQYNVNSEFHVELLPYHEYGKEKWKKLGLTYTVENGFVSQDRISRFTEMLTQNGIKVINT